MVCRVLGGFGRTSDNGTGSERIQECRQHDRSSFCFSSYLPEPWRCTLAGSVRVLRTVERRGPGTFLVPQERSEWKCRAFLDAEFTSSQTFCFFIFAQYMSPWCVTLFMFRSSTNGWVCKPCPMFQAMWRMCGVCWIILLLTFVIQTRCVPASFQPWTPHFSIKVTFRFGWHIINCSSIAQVYSLIGGFCASAVNFHAKDGSGYKLLADIVLQLDKLNPQVGYAQGVWCYCLNSDCGFGLFLVWPRTDQLHLMAVGLNGSIVRVLQRFSTTLSCILICGSSVQRGVLLVGCRLHHAWFRLSLDGGGLMRDGRPWRK